MNGPVEEMAHQQADGAGGAAILAQRLRQKLEPNPHFPAHILTVHRLGYRFVG